MLKVFPYWEMTYFKYIRKQFINSLQLMSEEYNGENIYLGKAVHLKIKFNIYRDNLPVS